MNRTAIVIVAGLAVGAGVIGWQALRPAPEEQSKAAAATQEGAPIAKVTPPAELSKQAQLGKRFFEAKCATCHGENAAGREGVAPPLVHRYYEPNHHGDMAFILAAKNGVRSHHWPFGDMPPVKGVTDGDVKMIIRYVRELQKANGIF